MPTATVEAIPANEPVDLSLLSVVGELPVQLGISGRLPSREEIIAELRTIHRAMRVWFSREPDAVLREASAYSARLAELRLDIRLAGTVDRAYKGLFTPTNDLHSEVEQQARWASRQIEVRRQDMDLSR